MKRRDFLVLLGGAAGAWPLVARAQQKGVPVIGFLGGTSAAGYAPPVAAFRQGLSETGYVEGQNLTIEYRWAEDQYQRLPALAADLVGRKVDVIVTAGGPPTAPAARRPRWRRGRRPRRYRSSSLPTATRSGTASSPTLPGRAAMSRG